MKNEILRHLLSTIEFRFDKSIALSNDTFPDYQPSNDCRTPKEIVHHIFQVLKYARIIIAEENIEKNEGQVSDWKNEIARFKDELLKVDRLLSEKELDINFSNKLIQGPFADILTHLGQLSMISRLNGKPIDPVNYARADINIGIHSNTSDQKTK